MLVPQHSFFVIDTTILLLFLKDTFTMNNAYNTYIKELNKLHACDEKKKSWNGHLYLPPCSCRSGTKCLSVNDTSTFDFEDFDDISLTDLVDICNYTRNESKSHFLRGLKSYYICKKYSLSSLATSMEQSQSLHERCSIVTKSKLLKEKQQLLIDDMKLLFPLTGSKFHFKSRNTKTAIKIQVMMMIFIEKTL